MAWGIFMLIVLLGAGNGLRNGVSYNFADVAVNSLTIWPGRTTKVYGGLQAGRQIKLDSTDITFLEKEFSQIYNVSPKIGLYGRNIFMMEILHKPMYEGYFPTMQKWKQSM